MLFPERDRFRETCMLKTPDLRSDPRAARILAKSIYRELTAQGYDDKQIVALATELIAEVTNSIGHDARKVV
jgi:hypothetical protein